MSLPRNDNRPVAVLPLVACLFFCAQSLAQSTIVGLDRIIAIVNDDVIVQSELDGRIEQVRTQLDEAGTPAPPYQVLQKQVLERLVIDRLQLQVAERTGIRVDDDVLNAAISDMAKKNGLSLREFRNILKKDGYNFADFREQVRQQITISQVRQRHVGDRIIVNDRDVENFLAMQERQGAPDLEYRLSHILIALPDGASPETITQTRLEGEEVLQQLKDGADFAETAAASSDGQQAFNGGALGWKRAGQLPTIFSTIVPQMKPGELSELIRSPSGFHIITVSEVRGHGQFIVTQHLSRHILIRPNELVSAEDAQVRLDQLKLRIEGGEDFAELARSHSDDRGTALRGGELGWLSPGALVPAFENEVNSLEPGGLSQPFKTQFGWHLVQLVDRREHDNTEEVQRAKARDQIRERKLDEEGQAWLRQIRETAYVEYRLEE